MNDLPGLLAGRYELGSLIGRGGMAEVYMGYDTRLSRRVAIKVLRADLARDPVFLARFRREAQSAAALNHPAIVAAYDTGEETTISSTTGKEIPVPYIVMEYVEGHTVRDLLAGGDLVPIDEAADIVGGVLGALDYSHRAGIIHRDIKPGNIMLTTTGEVKVMDFGIARAIADSQATMTQTQAVVGTAQYLSPEQARGETVDARSDLYSTGCLLYELLTGKPPFTGDSAVALAYQHVRELPKLPSEITGDIPASVDRVVMKALAKDRDDRYEDAQQMRQDLLSAVSGQNVSAPPTNVWKQVEPATATAAPAMAAAAIAPDAEPSTTSVATQAPEQKKKPVGLIIGIVALLLAAVGLGVFALLNKGPEEPVIKQVEVPKLEGFDQRTARLAIENAGLKFAIGEPVHSDTVTDSEFVESTPAPGTKVDAGSTVTVVFSKGPENTTVPDVSKLDQNRARETLENAGLRVSSVETVNVPKFRKGEVTETVPAAGTELKKDGEVQLLVASGNVELPNLVGKTREDAQKIINDLGLSIQFELEVSNTIDPGIVISQNKSAGIIPSGTVLVVNIAKEAEEAPQAPETPQGEDPKPEKPAGKPANQPKDDKPKPGGK